ncbi:MAG: glycerophosphodiester phosphodiesterase, partial [Chloroflexia bacterium]|nr:glycerophosphodiester phosphodiesterase [Chloroflexia bacterium]
HPVLPDHRPLAIAHRAGNNLDAARAAIAAGVDMLEADVWPRLGRLEIRHVKSIGPLPIYWERWYIDSIGGRHVRLDELIEGLPPDVRLFLDLKGLHPWLGRRVVNAIREIQKDLEIVVCGRNWRHLDPVARLPNVHIFYSIGDEKQLANVWDRLGRQTNPAVSIHHRLLTEETVARFKNLGTTIIAWTVNDPAIARALFQLGVDGFTSDNREMLADIVSRREHVFDDLPAR